MDQYNIKFRAGRRRANKLKRLLTANGIEIGSFREQNDNYAITVHGDKDDIEHAFNEAMIKPIEMKTGKLNEAVIDIGKFAKGGSDGDPGALIKLNKTKKTSILDDLEELDFGGTAGHAPQVAAQSRDIVEAPTLGSIQQQKRAVTASATNRASELKALMQLRDKKGREQRRQAQQIQSVAVAEPIAQQRAEENQQLVKDYNAATGASLPDETDLVTTVDQIEDALDEIPGTDAVELSDFDIVPAPMRKDKTGYTKTLVTIKKGSVPQEVSKLATEVKRLSKGIIKHRIMDMRTIGNTNKTQLRGSVEKLGLTSINFKPDGENRVNKGTRFIISLPDDFPSTKNVVVYIQESRDKFIIKLEGNSFSNWDAQQDFLAEAIANYYQYGFASTKTFLAGKDTGSPLLGVAKSVLKAGGFSVYPKTAQDGHVSELVIESKGTDNQWLEVKVLEGQLSGTYKVKCVSKIDGNWQFDINSAKGHQLTILDLNGDKFVEILHKLWKREWKMDEGDSREYYLLGKLTYRNLKQAFIDMWELTEGKNVNGLKVGETLSQKDTAKSIPGSYAAEGIVGKTSSVDYFILTYLAVQEKAGDKRVPEDYITTDAYHEKYSVANRGKYQERPNTILSKEGEKRNYHARIYKFQIEYAIGGVKSMVQALTFAEIQEKTGFLTDTPKTI
jgi:hypothetical protein